MKCNVCGDKFKTDAESLISIAEWRILGNAHGLFVSYKQRAIILLVND
jgi:hypothetical protein